jgi:transglutaminase-like putative cysteine protease
MPVFSIRHITKYEYDRPVKESMNEIRIFPVISEKQELLNHDVQISGSPDLQYFVDYWGNRAANFNLFPPHQELVIDSRLVVRTRNKTELDVNFISGFEELLGETSDKFNMMELARPEWIESLSSVAEIAGKVRSRDGSVAITIKNCSDYIFSHFKYIKGITSIETTIDEILEKRAGVCQDFAHLMLQVLRTMQIPSRYVSGYICPIERGLRGEGATHAWVEAWIPGSGWVGIDPTNNVWVINNHVKLATGRNFLDCSPVKGTFKGPARQLLTVFVSVDYEDGFRFNELTEVDFREGKTRQHSPQLSPAAQQ